MRRRIITKSEAVAIENGFYLYDVYYNRKGYPEVVRLKKTGKNGIDIELFIEKGRNTVLMDVTNKNKRPYHYQNRINRREFIRNGRHHISATGTP